MVKLEDLKGLEPKENWTSFDVLVAVARIALKKFNKKEKKKIKKKKHMLMIKQSPPKDSIEPKLKIRIKPPNPIQNPTKNPHFLDLKTCLATHFECKRDEEKPLEAKKQKKSIISTGPNPPPNMPLEFKNIIAAKGGSEITLVIQKGLFSTDVSKQQNRLSIPLNHIRSDFLTKEEKWTLDLHDGKNCEGIKCDLIEPSMEETDTTLKKWYMKKDSGKKSSSMYVLVTSWNRIVSRNKLDVGTIVQVWSFRVNSKLCFALVHVPD